MKDKHEPRLFPDDKAVRHIGEGLLACALRKAEWTHEAHLAACCWLVAERPDILPERDLPNLIRRFNESVGGVNSDSEGYHETITRVFLRGARLFLSQVMATVPPGTVPGSSLHELVNELLLSPMGQRGWPLRFYSPELLFSVEARRRFVEPDLGALP